MKITVKVSEVQIVSVIAQAWGCALSDVQIDAVVGETDVSVGATLVTDLKGATRAEKIIDRAMATKVSE